jgi:hypothetical protein
MPAQIPDKTVVMRAGRRAERTKIAMANIIPDNDVLKVFLTALLTPIFEILPIVAIELLYSGTSLWVISPKGYVNVRRTPAS